VRLKSFMAVLSRGDAAREIGSVGANFFVLRRRKLIRRRQT
jgi:hypothetical protein